MRLRLQTAGESHKPSLCGILDGMPHGLALDKRLIDADLRRHQNNYNHSGRQKIEHNEIEVVASVRGGRTMGSPIAFLVRNRDHATWTSTLSPWGDNPAAEAL